MTIGAISNVGPQSVNASPRTSAQRAAANTSALAQLFGETNQQVWSDVRSGDTSLSQLAQSRGISQTDLISAIEQRLQQTPTNGGAPWTDTQLSNVATSIANHVYTGQHTALAHLFGESSDQLTSDLQSGNTSLSALAASRGISADDLTAAIKQGLQHGLANAGSVPDWYLTDSATAIANRVHSAPPTGPTGAASSAASSAAAAAASGSSAPTSVTTDAERLMFDLQTTLQSGTAGSTKSWSTASSANLLDQLSRFNQTL